MSVEQGLLAGFAALITGIFTWLSTRAKGRADVRSAEVEKQASAAEITWKQTQEWLTRLERKVEELREENRDIRARHEELWRANTGLRAENRDQQNLIEELVTWILQWEQWQETGANGPPPRMSDRMKAHLEQIRHTQ